MSSDDDEIVLNEHATFRRRKPAQASTSSLESAGAATRAASSAKAADAGDTDDDEADDDGGAAGAAGSLQQQWALLEEAPREPCSENALSFAKGAMLVVEQYYENLFRSLDERDERRRTLREKMARLNLTPEQVDAKMQQLAAKETQYIRSRRVRLTGNTFESIRVIGRGAFGEVCDAGDRRRRRGRQTSTPRATVFDAAMR